MASKDDKGKVVIVGCGISGCSLALKLLKKGRDFTIINPTDYFHVVFAAVRTVAVPGWAEKTMVPLEPCFGEHFKKGKVIKIIPNENQDEQPGGKVALESGEEVEYRYLVIATGHGTKWPVALHGIGREEALQRYAELVEKVKSAQKIVIVGGGATGVEIAAELRSAFTDKEVSIINSNNQLVAPFSERSQQRLQEQLTNQFGIKLILGERVANLDELETCKPGTVTTDKGTTIEADIVLVVNGLKILTDAYKDGLELAMNERGQLKVDASYRVEGFPNIFAIGDCTSFNEPKIAALAMEHADKMAKTIFNLDRGKAPVVYKPDNFLFVGGVSLGPTSGFARIKQDKYFPVFIMKMTKAKKLFTDTWWKDLKQKCP